MSFQVFDIVDGSSSNVETIQSSLDPTPTVDFSGGSARLVLHLRSYHATLGRSDVRRYNSADQALEYPDDKGFDYVPAMVDATLSFIPAYRLK